ncbi:MAG: NAD-dependent epimerase/dehydratase family protein [Bacteriovoracaceae bacterium]|jgi:lipopolysaccharide/colanic/teichoic acid biosynthesis glycosyltransferase/dTDP-4-dehydrorhamnose reductase|nr:NAD-dependent epimerase/dehydratase family protein [Bacteriovoracaceae bacterium]
MKVLITGASGFVGRRLCQYLQGLDLELVGTSRKKIEIDGVKTEVVGELSEETNWENALRGVDTVVHLAARVHIMDDSVENPKLEYLKANFLGTKKLVQDAIALGAKKFVFISTIKVNGEGKESAYTEEDQPETQDPYGASKLEAENYLLSEEITSKIEVLILRPPLIYGPGVRANFQMLVKIISSGFFIPFNPEKNVRSMVYIDNFCSIIKSAISYNGDFPQVFLASDGGNFSTSKLIRSIGSSFGRKYPILPIPDSLMLFLLSIVGKKSVADRLYGSLWIDNSKLKKVLNWSPEVGPEEAIKITSRSFFVSKGSPGFLKRFFDLALALIATMILLVPFLILCLIVRLTSKGPALYWSKRVGKNNTIFLMPKFRTMRLDTPVVATHLLTDSQSFLTPPGSYLRKMSLDEIPQLISIWKGDMSFVGPRPALYNQDDLVELRTQKGVHKLIPGLTGWAQINGRDEISIPEKVKYDEEYLYRRSMVTDVKIFILTFKKILLKEGITH